ncbi:MAG TPA: iron-containing alcohol dehydrogenase, partial [Burkholderiaceae bacterium]|nr:iron-containing alcohol dehydrogenase [Burkholderiaceae bacterium]
MPAAVLRRGPIAGASQRYHNPVAIHFGAGALGALPALLRDRSVVVVTFPEARALGLVQRLERLLGPALLAVEDEVEPNPDVARLGAMYRRFWRDHGHCGAVVAIGGGSAIDTAKALIVGSASGAFDEVVASLAAGRPFVPNAVKPLIAIPTTAGTGSEVTPWATIWDRATGSKHSLHLDQTWPQHALVD